MARAIACPNCQRSGFVRVDRIVRGRNAEDWFCCERCDYNWPAAESDTDTESEYPSHQWNWLATTYAEVRTLNDFDTLDSSHQFELLIGAAARRDARRAAVLLDYEPATQERLLRHLAQSYGKV